MAANSEGDESGLALWSSHVTDTWGYNFRICITAVSFGNTSFRYGLLDTKESRNSMPADLRMLEICFFWVGATSPDCSEAE